ncbi:hypothetical protein V8B55DRAFT_1571292 [Mucor lusitanicus]|uniref:Uncharacterized protein n=1 Tax=Mucor lusitanicus CBS 277.49 TaxID=747725 RepID=A0A168HDJ6_MUCCL|nr:hypothetical protein MUCCIDRAFT_114904 [Mucor lusitanicus CBS 277.49]
MDTDTTANPPHPEKSIPTMTAFSIMFVSIGMSCFIWQSITAGQMFYKARKPIVGLVFAQATLGIVVTFVTLLTSLTPDIDCTFRLLFSVVGVNVADISLQFVLLWKAYLGNNRSKIILGVGCIPLLAIAAFIIANMTFGRSISEQGVGLCDTDYPTYIVIAKAAIDCTSNTFLSGCFVLVIYRHYRILGSSIQKTLITEGLIYCFGVCLSNILTGILMAKTVLGGSTPILYTIDWYLASYLIIKQLRSRHKHAGLKEEEDDDEEEDDSSSSIASKCDNQPYRQHDDEERANHDDDDSYHNKARDTYYQSIDGTVVAASITAVSTPHHSYLEGGDDAKLYPLPVLPPFEKKIYDYTRKNSATQLLEETDMAIETLAVRDVVTPESPKLAIPKAGDEK